MAFNYSPRVITDGLVLYLDAANTRSYPGVGTTWTDLSRSGYTGTLTNGPTFNSGNGGSIVFDGVDDYIVNSSFPTTNIYCISLWVKPTILVNSSSTIKSLIQLRYQAAAGNFAWYIAFGASTILVSNEYITITDASNNRRTCVADGGSLLANTWYNLVFNFESSAYKIYVNNTLKTTVNSPAGNVTLLTNPNRLYLSTLDGDGAAPRVFSDASIAQTLIYNRALSTTEILQNYNATKGRFGL